MTHLTAPLPVLTPDWSSEYVLIDTGNFRKLERFGSVVTIRPEPQAVWQPLCPEKDWLKQANVQFIQNSSHAGQWQVLQPAPERWSVQYTHSNFVLKFRLARTGFKHVGLFPEQAVNWDFIYAQCVRRPIPVRVLNLFAYTGGATLAGAAAKAAVTHVDSVKQIVTWANENVLLNQFTGVRWLVEDALRFVEREARRNHHYDGIILDPPAYGHGPNGERWQLEDLIDKLLANLKLILHPTEGFLVFNTYSLGFSALVLEALVRYHFPQRQSDLTCGELCLVDAGGRRLPAGVFARF